MHVACNTDSDACSDVMTAGNNACSELMQVVTHGVLHGVMHVDMHGVMKCISGRRHEIMHVAALRAVTYARDNKAMTYGGGGEDTCHHAN